MIKALMAAALAAACAVPMIAQASAVNDNIVIAQAGGGAAQTNPTSRAGSAGASASRRFDQLDRNHDGYISRDEARNAPELNTRFSELDKNNDGKLSREEYNALERGASGATGRGATGGARAPGAEPNLPASGSQARDSGGAGSGK